MRRSVRLLAGLVAVLAFTGTASAAQLPVPDKDPFYSAPADLASKPDGSVLRSREVKVVDALPIPGIRSWQIQYRSNDAKGKPIAAVTTLMVPTTPYLAGARRPLVSYQMAYDSLGSQCNPSYTLRTGTQKELPTLLPLLALGYAVTTADYEGPEMAWTAGRLAAHTVLDGIRAVEALPQTGLTGLKTPLALFGYSGGGQASAWAGEQQPAYAPELKLTAIAAGGVPADIEQVARATDGSVASGIELGGVFGLARQYPELDLDSLLNAKGRALKKAIAGQCLEQFVAEYPFARLRDYTVPGPDPLTLPSSRKVLAEDQLAKATPHAPVYLFHSILDEVVPISGADALATKYCRDGADVYYQRDVAGEHISYAITGSPAAYAYLAARFAGVKTPTNCGTFPAGKLGHYAAPKAKAGCRPAKRAHRRGARRRHVKRTVRCR